MDMRRGFAVPFCRGNAVDGFDGIVKRALLRCNGTYGNVSVFANETGKVDICFSLGEGIAFNFGEEAYILAL